LALIAQQRVPWTSKKIDRLMPKIRETERILNRRNSPLNSRAEILTDQRDGLSSCAEKICAEKSARYHRLEQSSGSRIIGGKSVGSAAILAAAPCLVPSEFHCR
jgi:hypothetical protein